MRGGCFQIKPWLSDVKRRGHFLHTYEVSVGVWDVIAEEEVLKPLLSRAAWELVQELLTVGRVFLIIGLNFRLPPFLATNSRHQH